MEQVTINALEEYYNLKDKYESAIVKARRNIIRDKSLDKSAKLRAIASLKTKCVNCGNLGGMVFTSEDKILKARCTATDGPCALDIEINRGDFETVQVLNAYVSGECEEARTKIIRTKLNMLFGFINEEEAMATFVNQKADFDSLDSSLRDMNDTFMNVVQGKKTLDQRKESNTNIAIAVDKLRKLSKQYTDTGNIALINEMVSHYINEIQPEATKYRELRFAKNTIECSNGERGGGKFTCDDGIYQLIQDPYTRQEAEVVLVEPAVLINNK
jgi:hypothetical protein